MRASEDGHGARGHVEPYASDTFSSPLPTAREAGSGKAMPEGAGQQPKEGAEGSHKGAAGSGEVDVQGARETGEGRQKGATKSIRGHKTRGGRGPGSADRPTHDETPSLRRLGSLEVD